MIGADSISASQYLQPSFYLLHTMSSHWLLLTTIVTVQSWDIGFVWLNGSFWAAMRHKTRRFFWRENTALQLFGVAYKNCDWRSRSKECPWVRSWCRFQVFDVHCHDIHRRNDRHRSSYTPTVISVKHIPKPFSPHEVISFANCAVASGIFAAVLRPVSPQLSHL